MGAKQTIASGQKHARNPCIYSWSLAALNGAPSGLWPLNLATIMRFIIRTISALLILLAPAVAMSDIPMCEPVPSLKESVAPEYPIAESPLPVNGYAIVEITISEVGSVSDARLIDAVSLPDSDAFSRGFGHSAIRAVRTWKFAPVNTVCRLQRKVTFTVSDSDG